MLLHLCYSIHFQSIKRLTPPVWVIEGVAVAYRAAVFFGV